MYYLSLSADDTICQLSKNSIIFFKNPLKEARFMSFKNLNLHEELLHSIEEAGYTAPTPIQEQTISPILEGKDLCACAPTGTGKTAAFILPILHRIITTPPKQGKGPRALILVPTRELAIQVSAQAIKYSRFSEKLTTVCVYGGVPYPVQKKSLSRPYEILVATPGRLIDHLERGRIKLSRLEVLVLDEADRMLDMGFIEPVEHIASLTPKERQTIMFSATLKESVIKLAKNLLTDPQKVTVAPVVEKQEKIDQRMHRADNLSHKNRLLEHFLKDPSINNALIFTSTKSYADELLDILMEQGHSAAVLHGDINQRKRTHTISQFRKGKIRILVATDVAARGIDVPSISHVINFDLPNNATDYVHRIGRTGRAGASGIAISFVSSKDMPVIREIESSMKQKITVLSIEGLEARCEEDRFNKKQRSKFSGSKRGSSFKNSKKRFGRRRDRDDERSESTPNDYFDSNESEHSSRKSFHKNGFKKEFARSDRDENDRMDRKRQRDEEGSEFISENSFDSNDSSPMPKKSFHKRGFKKEFGRSKRSDESRKDGRRERRNSDRSEPSSGYFSQSRSRKSFNDSGFDKDYERSDRREGSRRDEGRNERRDDRKRDFYPKSKFSKKSFSSRSNEFKKSREGFSERSFDERKSFENSSSNSRMNHPKKNKRFSEFKR